MLYTTYIDWHWAHMLVPTAQCAHALRRHLFDLYNIAVCSTAWLWYFGVPNFKV